MATWCHRDCVDDTTSNTWSDDFFHHFLGDLGVRVQVSCKICSDSDLGVLKLCIPGIPQQFKFPKKQILTLHQFLFPWKSCRCYEFLRDIYICICIFVRKKLDQSEILADQSVATGFADQTLNQTGRALKYPRSKSLVGGCNPTYLKNMRKSNSIIPPWINRITRLVLPQKIYHVCNKKHNWNHHLVDFVYWSKSELKKHACHFCTLQRVAKLCIFLEGRETAPLPSQQFAPPMKKTAAVSLWLKLLVGAYSWHMIQYLHLTYSIYHQIISHHTHSLSVYDMDYDINWHNTEIKNWLQINLSFHPLDEFPIAIVRVNALRTCVRPRGLWSGFKPKVGGTEASNLAKMHPQIAVPLGWVPLNIKNP